MKTVVSETDIKFYDNNDIPYAQMISQGSELKFVDENNQDIEIENMNENIEEVTLSNSLLDSNGKYNLDLNTDNNFNIEVDTSSTLRYINFSNIAKGHTGKVTLSLDTNSPKLITFMGSGASSTIKWVSENKENYESGTHIFGYFVVSNTELLLWNLNSMNSGTSFTPLDTSSNTIQEFTASGSYTLPLHVNTFTAYMWGAGGNGGLGGYTQSTITLPECGMTIQVIVGKATNGSGGGASILYYTYQGQNYDILVAGGGGTNNGGGLISEGKNPASMLNGTFSTNYTTGLGQSDGSGSGYYSGSNGAGGSGYIGSNIHIINNNISVDNYGDLNNYSDNQGRLDTHNKCIYTNSVCTSLVSHHSDYYHDASGGTFGNSGQDGYVYISIPNVVNTNVYGIESIETSTYNITLHASSVASYYKFYIYYENILKESGTNFVLTPFVFSKSQNGTYHFYVYAYNNGYIGDLVHLSENYTQGTNEEILGLNTKSRSVQIQNYNNMTNIALQDNGKTFYLNYTKLPSRVYINHDSILNFRAYDDTLDETSSASYMKIQNLINTNTTLTTTVVDGKFQFIDTPNTTRYYIAQGTTLTFNYGHHASHVFQIFQENGTTLLFDQAIFGNIYNIGTSYTGPLVIKCANHQGMGDYYTNTFYIYNSIPDYKYLESPGLSLIPPPVTYRYIGIYGSTETSGGFLNELQLNYHEGTSQSSLSNITFAENILSFNGTSNLFDGKTSDEPHLVFVGNLTDSLLFTIDLDTNPTEGILTSSKYYTKEGGTSGYNITKLEAYGTNDLSNGQWTLLRTITKGI